MHVHLVTRKAADKPRLNLHVGRLARPDQNLRLKTRHIGTASVL